MTKVQTPANVHKTPTGLEKFSYLGVPQMKPCENQADPQQRQNGIVNFSRIQQCVVLFICFYYCFCIILISITQHHIEKKILLIVACP